jgi:hypothetical protein
MPLPSPKGSEKQSDFVSRCMGTSVMKNDFPDQKQRAAVCYSQWRKAKNKGKSDGTFKDFIDALQNMQ